jgi:hypothetical protein
MPDQIAYISYAPIDIVDALACAIAMQRENFRVIVSDGRQVGVDARRDRIRSSNRLLFVRSRAGEASQLCKLERTIAQKHEIPVFYYDARSSVLGSRHASATAGDTHPSFSMVPEPDILIDQESPTQKRDVFISLSSRDNNDVEKIRDAFRRAKVTWWDYAAAARRFDQRLDREIEQAIVNCGIFVAVQSNNYEDSYFAINEYEFARAIGKPILHIQFQVMRPTMRSANKVFIDCIKDPAEGLRQLLQAVTRHAS